MLLFDDQPEGRYGKSDIYGITRETEELTRFLTDPDVDEFDPAVSPDGNWLAFLADRDGQSVPDLYIQRFPAPLPGDGEPFGITSGAQRLDWDPRKGELRLYYETSTGFLVSTDLWAIEFEVPNGELPRVTKRNPIGVPELGYRNR